ncbi:N-6 DNA methylase [Bacteroidota bacterium]
MNILDKRIWEVVNINRGHIDVSELKEIFISLICLKYINDTFRSEFYDDIHIPKQARWDFLIGQIGSAYFKNNLLDAFNILERSNDKLAGTFSTFNFQFNNIENIIKRLFFGVSEIDFNSYDIDFVTIIGDLLLRFSDSEGRKGGEFTTPTSVSQLMVKVLNPKEGIVLDSVCGTGGFFQKIKENNPKGDFQFYGQEYMSSTLALAKLRFAFNKKNEVYFGEAKNTLLNDEFSDTRADFVVMNPPFSLKNWSMDFSDSDPRFQLGVPPKNNANLAWIQHAVYHLNNTGKAAVLLNNSSLFSSGKEGEIRKHLINADVIEAIITLPSQLLSYSSISSSLWILNKNKIHKNEILFIDALDLGQMINKSQRVLSDEDVLKISTCLHSWRNSINNVDEIGFSKSVSVSEIKNQEFQLLPSRYIEVEALNKIDLTKAVKLREVLNYVRPRRLEPEVFYKKVSIKDLSSTPDSYLLNIESLGEVKLRPDDRILEDGFLLIARLGNKLKPTFTKKENEELAFSSNSIYSFTVNQNLVNVEYLIAELDKDYVKAQIDQFVKGAAISFIKRQDLENIKILLPVLEEQKEILEEERKTRFQSIAKDLGFEKEIEKLKESQMRDLGSKKHNIMQHLNNVKASADVLTTMMEINEGVLKSDQIIDPRRGVTVEKRFLRLQESLEKVIYYVENLTNDIKYDSAEILNINNLIKECKERGVQDDLFSIEIILEKESFQGREPLISISKNDFEEIYNNLVENAINHGFVDKTKLYVFRIYISYIDDFLEISFMNNGKPFPKGIAEKILIKGEKAGGTGGTGIGLWKVNEITKHFGGKLEVYDEPENNFPVGFKFKFNMETL